MGFWEQLIAYTVAVTVRELCSHADTIVAAFRLAAQRTVADAGQAPKETLDEIDHDLAAVGVHRPGAD